ncbi:MAG TPA: hypothetical protein VFO40_15220 [Chthoniobacterales bacterium]|nr:hypothetical protein [Chthoniobacterales bacterium]
MNNAKSAVNSDQREVTGDQWGPLLRKRLPNAAQGEERRKAQSSKSAGIKKAGLAPTKARPALYTNFCSTKSEEPTASSSLSLIGFIDRE